MTSLNLKRDYKNIPETHSQWQNVTLYPVALDPAVLESKIHKLNYINNISWSSFLDKRSRCKKVQS